MENKCYFCHGEIISNAHPWTGSEWKEIFYLFGLLRIRKNKPVRIKSRFIAPVFFISVQTIKKRYDDRPLRKTESIKCIIV